MKTKGKTQAAKPSPLPWTRRGVYVIGCDGRVVAKPNLLRPSLEREANAQIIERAVNSHAAVMAKIKSIAKAHDRLSDAVEDPDGGNDAEHDAAVKLLGKLLDLYAALRAAGESV